MGKEDKPGAYQVGFGRPPRNTQFKKGESGNPKGRPKGTLNLATVLERTLREQVVINENGRRKVITKLEAAVKQLVNKAASGDLAAHRQLLALVISAEERASQTPATAGEMSEADRLVMQSVLKRFEATSKGDSGHEPNN
jgi:hypothetical protein